MKATKLNVNRDVYEVPFGTEGEFHGALVTLVFENPTDGDKSVVQAWNRGEEASAIVTVAAGYTGTDSVTVRGSAAGSPEATFDVEFAG